MTLQAAWPSEIHDHRASRVLELVWPDGERSRLSHRSLRAACRCAECESLRRIDRSPSGDAVEIADITPVSDTGLQLHFSDGHQRGIFPWAYLRQLADGATA